MSLLLLISVSFVILLLHWYIQHRKYFKHLKKYHGPTPLPILGHALYFRKTEDLIPNMLKFLKNYGETVPICVGWRFLLFTTDCKFLEFILKSTTILKKSKEYDHLLNWLGNGLLLASGEHWRKHRKILTPAFHFQILEQFVDVFNKAGDILINKLQNENGKPVNISSYVSLCSLDVICESAMGTTINAQLDSVSDYVRSVQEMCRIHMSRTSSPLKQFNFFYRFTTDYYKEKRALKILHDFTNVVIQERKSELEKNEMNRNQIDPFGKKRRLAFLDLLLQFKTEGKPLSDEEIREEVDTFMFEGHDTTASATSFALFSLANNPEIQAKVMEEMNEIFSDDINRPVTYRDLQEMKYLEMVIKETLRLYPSVPAYTRQLEEDVEYDGYTLKKGLALVIYAFGIGRNPTVFPDPEKFDPERFNSEYSIGRNPFSYLPFSAGSRNCIGQRFAMLEMKSLLSKIIRNYELFPTNPPHELKLIPTAVMISKNGVHIQLKERTF